MYAKSFSILALAAASLVAAEDFTVATPPYVQQCSPLKITWKGGEPPYRPFITAPGKIDDVKENLDETSDTSTTWKVTIPQGQKFTINICDNSGQCQASGEAGPVGKGDDSCINGGGNKGGSSGGGGGAAAAGGGGSSGGSSGGDDKKSGDGDDKKSGGDDKKSSSSSDNKSSSSSGGKSSSSSGQSSTGGGSGGGSSSAQPSSTGMGGGSDDKSGQDNKEDGSDNNGGEKKGDDSGSMSFSGVPAVVAGVVGVVVAALI
ncbi:hypothetical protein MGL_2668 [Malassezia globosa CBS 7966]|uniref:Phytocyanin domain-containing protein n=1 Tax=Malassezia globosa (strain ATCC MYA-4612 / CBS 7966) TaxID=425265 RepID=A8Q4X9_MALGO|nr:uncharacterized protein MGL_2668 [Malassezia globosa CBS 7966]EDP43072.1 hypothetical protein MGL_2668 [Malassezia globosa CBS 7966]